GVWRAYSAARRTCLWQADGEHRARRIVVRAYVRAPQLGVWCRNFSAQAARELVSARRRVIGPMNEVRTKVAARELWQPHDVNEGAWNDALAKLASGAWTLFGLWGEPDRLHLAALTDNGLCVLRVVINEGAYPSVAAKHPPATRLE